MAAVTRGAPASAVSLPTPPDLPPDVAQAVDRLLNPTIDGHLRPPAEPVAAHRLPPLLAAYDALLAPVTPAQLRAWLLPVNLACRNPQGRPDFEARCAAIAELLGDLPGAAFTSEARRALRCEFFPGAEDVRRAVQPAATRWQMERSGLEMLLRRAAQEAP